MREPDLLIVKSLKDQALRNKAPLTEEDRNNRSLAAKVIGLIDDSRIMASNWGFYLFSDEFDREPELRGRITVIMISALLDTLEAEQRVVDVYKTEAVRKDFTHMAHWCDRAKDWCDAVQDVLGMFTKADQLYIQNHRDNLVHGWLNKKHQETVPIKYFDGSSLQSEKIPKEDYFDYLKVPMLGIIDGNTYYQKGFIEILNGYSDKLINPELRYWRLVNWLNNGEVMNAVYKEIYSDIGVDWTPEPLNLFENVFKK